MPRLLKNFCWWEDGSTQCLLVDDGRVVQRGVGLQATEETDLQGRWLMPAFVDAHCHILPTGLDLQKLHLGDCQSHQDVLQAVADRHRELPEDQWLMAVHYDQTKYENGQHLTLTELDKISESRPIILRHSSGHASVTNSAALKAAGVSHGTPNPKGGAFRRDSAGNLDGVLLEHAHEHVTAAAPSPTRDEMVQAILAAGEEMSKFGIACASDMMTGRYDLLKELDAYRIASENGLKVRVRLYMQWGAVFGPRRVDSSRIQEAVAAMDPSRCRVAGIKIFADGAIGSATAAIYGRYSGAETDPRMVLSKRAHNVAGSTPEGVETAGQLIYSPERLYEMVQIAHDKGYSIAVHSIGDYSTDLVLDAFQATGEASRHRLEHAMLLSDAQIERIARLQVPVTMQPEFLLRFGHAYLMQLGPERASRLKRFRSVIDAGIELSFNSDRPIVPGNPWDGIFAACHRPSFALQDENVSFEEAVGAYSVQGARVNDDLHYAQLLPGQLADLQLYDHDPRQMENNQPLAVSGPVENDLRNLRSETGNAC